MLPKSSCTYRQNSFDYKSNPCQAYGNHGRSSVNKHYTLASGLCYPLTNFQVRTDTLIDLVLEPADSSPSLIRASGFGSEDDLLDAVSSDDSDEKQDTAEKSDETEKKASTLQSSSTQSPLSGKDSCAT